MITPIQAVQNWLEADPEWPTYAFDLARGLWRDTTTNRTRRIAQLMQNGGRSPIADVSFNVVSLILLGPQKGMTDAPKLEIIAESFRQRLFEDFKVCEVAQIRLLGGIVGPGYTTEDRPWYELQLEVIT